MSMRKHAGVKLASVDGQHVAWTDPVLTQLVGGFGLSIDCHLAGVRVVHWLAPHPSGQAGRYDFTDRPYAWPSISEAFAAMDAYRAQQQGEE